MEGRINHAQTLSGSVIVPMLGEKTKEEGIPTDVGILGRNHHKNHIHKTESQPETR